MENYSAQSTPPQQYTPEPPRKRSHKKAFVITLIIIAVLVIGGLLGWYFLTHYKQASPTTPATASVTPRTTSPQYNKKQLVDDVKTDIDQRLSAQYPAMSLTRQTAQSPGYRVADSDFYTTVKNGEQLYIKTNNSTDTANSTAVTKAITDYLTSKDLKQTSSIAPTGYSVIDFQSNTAVCSIVTQQGTDIDFRCADKTDYTQAAHTLQSLKGFIDTIPKSPFVDYGDERSLSIEQEKASQTAGYQLIQIAVSVHSAPFGGGTNIFAYKKDSGDWTYFTTSEEMMKCNAYNTPELRAAYKGESCVDAKGYDTTTVQ